MSDKIRLVCATRESREAFFTSTALGRSLSLYGFPFVEVRLFPGNTQGLPHCYNTAIDEAAADPALLVFIHDDIWLIDLFWVDRLIDAARAFDISGVAGNRRRLPGQPAWHLADNLTDWDARENLSGIVAQGSGFPPTSVSFYGPAYQEVKLLDGALLVVPSAKLARHSLRFDERFDFHCYDMDFCRSAEQRGMSMGTWPLSIAHESSGTGLGSASWSKDYARYIEKWGD
ncbi:MAG: glycosyltransferase [Burkholderiales bacterium]